MAKAYRSNKYGGIYSDNFNTPVGRLFWLYVATPKEYKGPRDPSKPPPTPKYEVSIAFEKENPKTATLMEALKAETAEMISNFNVGKKTKLGEVELFQDGEADQELTTKYPWLKGCYFITCRSMYQPKTVDRAGDEYPTKDLQGGMKGKVAFQCCISNAGLSYTLEGLQFWEDDGQRFGGSSRNPAALFSACDDESSVSAKSAETPATEAVAHPPTEPVAAKGQKGKAALVNML